MAEAQIAHEVTHLFGLIGDANLFMVDAFVKANQGRYIACKHEATVVLAALGFAQVSGCTAAPPGIAERHQ